MLVEATGSQGEPRAGLNQLAKDKCFLDEDDLVMFSSITFPGYEKVVDNLLKVSIAPKI
ncbi:MAG: ribonuclease J [Paraglaciecola sp.]